MPYILISKLLRTIIIPPAFPDDYCCWPPPDHHQLRRQQLRTWRHTQETSHQKAVMYNNFVIHSLRPIIKLPLILYYVWHSFRVRVWRAFGRLSGAVCRVAQWTIRTHITLTCSTHCIYGHCTCYSTCCNVKHTKYGWLWLICHGITYRSSVWKPQLEGHVTVAERSRVSNRFGV